MNNVHRFQSILAFIVMPALFASCNPVMELGRHPATVAPFVQLKDGTVIKAKEAGQEMEFHNSRILADDQAFPRKKVAMYSNGEQTFVNLGKGEFGPKVAEGKIMVYSVTNAAHYGFTPHLFSDGNLSTLDYNKFKGLYIQDSGSSDMYRMRYRTLKRMIPDHTPAGKVLASYKNTRTIASVALLGGFASFIAGSFIAGNGVTKNNGDATIKTGLTMIFGGMGVMIGTTVPFTTNKMKMRRAIAIRNGVLAYH